MTDQPVENRFELGTVWGHVKDDPNIQRKTAMFESMIPPDVENMLDVGCGDGAITNALGEKRKVVGLDFSEVALRHLTVEGVLGSADHIPFPDRSFDLVLSSQLLEHLDQDTYERSLAELRRVASRYLLVSVPYREDLRFRQVRCPRCGWHGHVWGHKRRFTAESLVADLRGFEAVDVRIFGALETPPWPQWLLWPLQNLLHSFYTPTGQSPFCERCHNADFSGARGIHRHFYRVKAALDRRGGKARMPFWIAVLAKRDK
jgi:SAM-dependent methyltransferase